LVEQVPKPAVVGVHVSGAAVEVELAVDVAVRPAELQVPVDVGRVVAELRVFADDVGAVDAEPVDPTVEPALGHVEHGLPDFGVVPVEVGHAVQVGMQGILTGRWVPGPGRSAPVGQPVVGWPTVGSWVTPDIPLAFGGGT
jgi:hypothetical protein